MCVSLPDEEGVGAVDRNGTPFGGGLATGLSWLCSMLGCVTEMNTFLICRRYHKREIANLQLSLSSEGIAIVQTKQLSYLFGFCEF